MDSGPLELYYAPLVAVMNLNIYTSVLENHCQEARQPFDVKICAEMVFGGIRCGCAVMQKW